MARDTTTMPRQLPSSDSELAVLSELNLQVTLTGDELVRTFTVPLPVQLPSSSEKIRLAGLGGRSGKQGGSGHDGRPDV